jgi:hypothetical protein
MPSLWKHYDHCDKCGSTDKQRAFKFGLLERNDNDGKVHYLCNSCAADLDHSLRQAVIQTKEQFFNPLGNLRFP